MTTLSPNHRTTGRGPRAFSLIEVLMAIFILGIGAISIAALFPAGIAQQRRSVDDVLGPVVANNAIAIIRGKVRQEDFGAFEEFSPPFAGTLFAPRITVEGDWTWLRPSVQFEDDNTTNEVFERGAVDIFSRDWFDGTGTAKATEFPDGYRDLNGTGSVPMLNGIPFSRHLYGDIPPRILITQRERYYPMATVNSATPPRPQYVWDCMFRRYQGKVLVAIFVYRVHAGGGEPAEYFVPRDPGGSTNPPLPIWLDLTQGGAEPWRGNPWNAYGLDPLDVSDDALIPGTDPGDQFDLDDQSNQWQVAGQWILDQNANVHRVLSGRENVDAGPVELIRPVPETSSLIPVNYVGFSPLGIPGLENVVTDIWYLPASTTDAEGRELRLTPVYLTVKEL